MDAHSFGLWFPLEFITPPSSTHLLLIKSSTCSSSSPAFHPLLSSYTSHSYSCSLCVFFSFVWFVFFLLHTQPISLPASPSIHPCSHRHRSNIHPSLSGPPTPSPAFIKTLTALRSTLVFKTGRKLSKDTGGKISAYLFWGIFDSDIVKVL